MRKILKSIYDLIPFKHGLFLFIRKAFRPGQGIYRHLHFKGVIDIKIDDDINFKMNHEGYQIENEIFWRGLEGGWEKESVEIWIKLAQNAVCIFDVGANTGVFSLIAKAVNPSARVYAFEPVLRVHEKLKNNNDLNNFDIKSYPLAISNLSGKAFIYDEPAKENILGASVNTDMTPPNTAGTFVKTEIDTITLDDFIDANHLEGINLMKIDVETHEGEVMEGFIKHLSTFRPSLLIEILRNEVGARVQNALSGMGYLYFNINETEGPTRVNDILRRGHNFNYLLCTPAVAKKLGLHK